MATIQENTRFLRARLRSNFVKLATGGDWALTQPAATRRNLIWFWLDGFFASASDNIVVTYLVVYLVTVGATQAQIGMMSSLSSLSAAVLLLPGAMLVERLGRRRGVVLVGGGWARIALLCLALLPFVANGPWLIAAAIALSISRDAMANLSYPAWMAMTGDIVPMEGRGKFFSSRNFIMGLAGIVTTLVAGLVISRIQQPLGYQAMLLVAFGIGLFSVFSFSRLSDRPRPAALPQVKKPFSWKALLAEMRAHREFTTFAAITALWNFTLNIAGPFFNVYMVQNLHADAAMIGLASIATSVATMLVQPRLGVLNDRWGARRLTLISGLLIPILPFCWLFIDAPWQIIPVNLLGGALWGGFNMGSFNYLLEIAPEERRARYSAVFQIVVTLSLAVGAALGSFVVTQYGYMAVFLSSAVGRLVCMLLFAFLAARAARVLRASHTAAARAAKG